MPRPPKYDWEDKRDICYKLWVEDKLSGNQIVKWFADHFNLPKSELPNANQFHQHFKKWGFPLRREAMPAEQEERLLARVQELFNSYNTVQEILKTLNDEGWEMDDYHLRVFRKKHGMMMMRNQKGYKPVAGMKRKYADGEEAGDEDVVEKGVENGEVEEPEESSTLPPEEAARRAQRLVDLQLKSDEQLRTKKRRRRIRGYGHLPPDEPGLQPRYGSETSLDECKAFLQLSNEMYVQVRSQFDAICRELDITKMSRCAEGEWQAAKDRLVRENMHLSSVLHPLQPDLDKRLNALNCICSDVTKRIRSEGKRLTIAEASNILGLDPLQSKEIRRVFYEILEADQFTTVVACGKEHLTELREQWYAKCPVVADAVASGDPQKMQAVDALNKDARKRYCDDQTKKYPDQRQWQNQKHYGPGPGPAKGVPSNRDGKSKTNVTAQQTRAQDSLARRPYVNLGPSWIGHEPPELRPTTIADVGTINFDLDPLLQPTHGPPWPPPAARPAAPAQESSQTAHLASLCPGWPPKAPQSTAAAQEPGQTSQSIPVYFRLHPDSTVVSNHPRLWLGKVAPSWNSLMEAATSKAGAATVRKMTGVIKNQDGSEDSWVIENDEELEVYLGEAGDKATFVVLLQGGYA